MSSRVLKKLGLQGENDLALLPDEASDVEADLSSSGARKKQLNLNRYDVLNEQSHSESEVKEDDDHETTSSQTNNDLGSVEVKDVSRKKKKKKKKKAPTHKVTTNARSSEDNIEDEVDRSVRQVNAMLGKVEPLPTLVNLVTCPTKDILAVEHRNLNPSNELKRIFGSKIVQQTEQLKKRGRVRGHPKTTVFTSPKENWPQIGKPAGLSMKLLKTENGLNYFTYQHSTHYQQIQMDFLDAVDTSNPDNIGRIIMNYPYHVDALLQLSELCRLNEDFSMNAELIERALYALECAFHPSFVFTNAKARLDYRKQENRALFIALFKHLTLIGQRACYRTALELSKVLLSFDPENDPLAITLILDFYAIRSQQYSWFLNAAAEWNATRNVYQLPNFAFGVAIANFLMDGGKNRDLADEQLQNALILFPGVLFPLLEKCGAQPDSRLLAHPLFNHPTESSSLQQLEILYVVRCHHIWRDPELLPWLEKNLPVVLDRLDSAEPVAVDLRQKVKKWYQASTPRNILRHLLLLDLKEVPFKLPPDCPRPILCFDPLPPIDAVNIYNRPTRVRSIENSSSLSIFFRSLMPNFDINEPAGTPEVEFDAEGAIAVGELPRRVTSFLDAMRDLLSNIHMPDIPVDGDIDDDSEDDQPDLNFEN